MRPTPFHADGPPTHRSQESVEDAGFFVSLAFDRGLEAIRDQQKAVERSVAEFTQQLKLLETRWHTLEDRVVGSLGQQQHLLMQQVQQGQELLQHVGLRVPEPPSSDSDWLEQKLDWLRQQSETQSELLDQLSSKDAAKRATKIARASRVLDDGVQLEIDLGQATPGGVATNGLDEPEPAAYGGPTKRRSVHSVASTSSCHVASCHDFHIKTVGKLNSRKHNGSYCRSCLKRCGYTPHSSEAHRNCSTFVKSRFFNAVCTSLTLIFSLFAGVEANTEMQTALESEDMPEWIDYTILCFNCWFALEVSIRICGEGCEFFHGRDWRWNLFDLLLVLLSAVFVAADGFPISFFRALRGFKIVKAFRIFRIFRLFKEMRLLVATMLSSLASLLWSLVFTFVITYLWSIVFIQAGSIYIKDNEQNKTTDVADDLRYFFGSVPQGVYFLIASITGGTDWVAIGWPLWQLGTAYGCLYTMFVLGSIMGILNIITGVFVEHATNIPRIDRDFAINEHIASMEQDIQETMMLFHHLDPGNHGCINVEELANHMTDERVIAHFATLAIDITDGNHLGLIIDANHDGFVTLEEFVVACVKLRGSSKKADTAGMMIELQNLVTSVQRLDRALRFQMQEDLREVRPNAALDGCEPLDGSEPSSEQCA